MRVIDNFLSNDEFQKIRDGILFEGDFVWSLSHGKTPDQCEDDLELQERVKDVNFQFVHTFFDDSQWYSNKAQLIVPLFQNLDYLSLIRIKANLTMPSSSITSYGFHTDVHPDVSLGRSFNTAVFYLNDNDGHTLFENGDKVDSVANRIVIFDGNTKHAASTFTNAPWRAVVNLNWV